MFIRSYHCMSVSLQYRFNRNRMNEKKNKRDNSILCYIMKILNVYSRLLTGGINTTITTMHKCRICSSVNASIYWQIYSCKYKETQQRTNLNDLRGPKAKPKKTVMTVASITAYKSKEFDRMKPNCLDASRLRRMYSIHQMALSNGLLGCTRNRSD